MSSIMTTNRNSTMTAPTYTRISTTARNSASISSQMAALVKKHSTSSSAECTGLRTVIMASAATARIDAKIQKRTSTNKPFSPACLLVRGVGGLVGRDQRVVALAHGEQLVLGHDVFAAMLHVVLVDARFDDGVHRAGLLAEAAVDALEEIDVVARGAPRAVVGHVGFDGDGQRRAHRLAQLAGDAALLAVRVAAQRMQPAEARRLRRLLLRVVDRDLGREEFPPRDPQAAEQLAQRECLDDASHS